MDMMHKALAHSQAVARKADVDQMDDADFDDGQEHRRAPRIDTFDDLPPPDTTRWVSSRKALVVAAVKSGRLSAKDACARYNLSAEELESWQRLLDRHGTQALRATRVQDYRAATKRSR
jgi:hypothetical protein